MALLRLPFKLGRPGADTPVATTDGIDDDTLGLTQAALNALFNQGKGVDAEGHEVQVGKTYTGGTGIAIDPVTNEVSLRPSALLELGGIRSQVSPTYMGGQTAFPVVVNGDGTASTVVPLATDHQQGLMTPEDHRRLKSHAFTVDFGSREDTVTVMHMDGAATIVRVVTRNVSRVSLSVVNGGSVTPELADGKADTGLPVPSEGSIVIDIERTAAGRASVGVKYELE